MYLSTENLCNSKHTHYSTYCISPKTSLTTREQLHVKVSLRYITEHLSQVLWTLRTSWERLRSWRGCGMPSWSSCTLCAPWRSPSTSSQSWWRMAACWSTSRVRQPHCHLHVIMSYFMTGSESAAAAVVLWKQSLHLRQRPEMYPRATISLYFLQFLHFAPTLTFHKISFIFMVLVSVRG